MIKIKIDASRKVLARKMEGDGPLIVEQLKLRILVNSKTLFRK